MSEFKHLYEHIIDKNGQVILPLDKTIAEMTGKEIFSIMGGYKCILFPEYWYQETKTYLDVSVEKDIHESLIMCDAITKLAIFLNFEKILKKKGFNLVKESNYNQNDNIKVAYEEVEVGKTKYKILKNAIQFWEKENFKLVVKAENDYLYIFSNSKNEKDIEKIKEELIDFGKKHSFLKNRIIRSNGVIISFEKEYSWDDYVGPESVKKDIMDHVVDFLSKLDLYKANNIALKRGIILEGDPGNGKTLITKIIASTMTKQKKCTFMWVTCQDMMHGNLRDMFGLARKLAPCVVCMEDMDFYASERDENYSKSILGEMLAQLDGFEENHGIIIIGTTNKVDIIEKAIKDRPSRFDKVIPITKPSEEYRLEMLKNKFKNVIKGEEINWKEIAKKTADYSGAHIEELRTLAHIEAIKNKSVNEKNIVILKQQHIDSAIENIKINKDAEPHFVNMFQDDEEGFFSKELYAK